MRNSELGTTLSKNSIRSPKTNLDTTNRNNTRNSRGIEREGIYEDGEEEEKTLR